MSHIIADLQLHSKYSRAVSKEMTLANLRNWSIRKGINLIATGDWTHPLWFREIENELEDLGNGLFGLKKDKKTNVDVKIDKLNEPQFLLATEVSCIYKQNEKVRRVHTLIWVPSLESARKINLEMTKRGCNLLSDGRPIIGLTSIQVAELVLSIEPESLIIPAHAWTPWFSVYGSLGGFDSINEAFGEYSKYIYAAETGLSSSPGMNWQIPELDNRAIISCSDAHSLPKIGREATVFDLEDLSYKSIKNAILNASDHLNSSKKTTNNISFTIEFYPEEGKYHYNGHRSCNIRQTPNETRQKGIICPVCGKKITVGVMQRVEDLSVLQSKKGQGRSIEDLKLFSYNDDKYKPLFYKSQFIPTRPGYTMLVPLQEIIAEAIGSPFTSKKTIAIYDVLLNNLGNEFKILLSSPVEDVEKVGGPKVAEALKRVRSGDIYIDPGFDGEFGVVKIWKNEKDKSLINSQRSQLSFFN